MDGRVLELFAAEGLTFDHDRFDFSFPPVPAIDLAEHVVRRE
jgi:hypothetical protein